MLENEVFNRPYVRDITKTCECTCSVTCNPDIITNADRIRAMSDEELALQFGANCPKENRRACDRMCSKCWLEWLRQPSEEGT